MMLSGRGEDQLSNGYIFGGQHQLFFDQATSEGKRDLKKLHIRQYGIDNERRATIGQLYAAKRLVENDLYAMKCSKSRIREEKMKRVQEITSGDVSPTGSKESMESEAQNEQASPIVRSKLQRKPNSGTSTRAHKVDVDRLSKPQFRHKSPEELLNFKLVEDHLPDDERRAYTQMKTRRDSMSPKPRESRLLNRPVENSNVLSSETDDVEVVNDKPPQ